MTSTERTSPPDERKRWRVEDSSEPPKRPWWRPPVLPGGRRLRVLLVALLVVNILIAREVSEVPEYTSVPYTTFRAQVVDGNVAEVTSKGFAIQGEFERSVDPPGKETAVTKFSTLRPAFASDDELLQLMIREDVVVNARDLTEQRPVWQVILLGFGPTLLLVGALVFIVTRLRGMPGLGKSEVKRYEDSPSRVTFADVAGIDEAKADLAEIVDYLREPERYRALGAEVPRGVLLSGLPGTGKTLLARAVAGEADVAFFSISASEFIEMVVGVGASRVRSLFKQAKENAPAIVFIDELDAVGRARGGGPARSGGSEEREQTLNQILTEMDGFSGYEGVIVLASTNRPDVLDSALLRPGRFDRRVAVNPPDRDGRRRILEVHTRGVPLGDDVDLGVLAATTPGMVGADLRNLANEAALGAARRRHDTVTARDFAEALERVLLGAERRITIDARERERTAYHEAGHALLGMLQPGADPVRKVSIIPRGQSLGVTLQSAEADRYAYALSYLRGRIIGMLGGRAAEEIVYGEVTTGAVNDLEQITNLARNMVGRFGMSDAVGLVSVYPGGELSSVASEGLRKRVDDEVRRLMDECYDIALGHLRANRERLEALKDALLEQETLDEHDAYQAAGFDRPPAVDRGPEPSAVVLDRAATPPPGDDGR